MLTRLRDALESEPDVAYAVLFGSNTRGTAHAGSDADVAVEFRPGAPRDMRALGGLAARLRSAIGRPVDLVLLDEAPAPLAYRIFRDGSLLVERDHRLMVARKARALLTYLDWKPVEDRCAEGILRVAAGRGR